jgi:hypothetical protein
VFKRLFNLLPKVHWTNDYVPEGVWATDIQDPETRARISQRYQQRFSQPQPNPETHPWLFDPFDPPPGWKYDPYYEWWSKE